MPSRLETTAVAETRSAPSSTSSSSVPEPAPSPADERGTPLNLPEIPPVTSALPPDSSLVLVETRHGALSTSDEMTDETPHPKRTRPPRVEITSEPLEMVETHKGETRSDP